MRKAIIIIVIVVVLVGLISPVISSSNLFSSNDQTDDIADPIQNNELSISKKILSSCLLDSPFKKEWPITMCEQFDGVNPLWEGVSNGTIALVQDEAYIVDNRISENRLTSEGYTVPIVLGAANDALVSIYGEMECLEGECGWGVFLRSTIEEIRYVFLVDSKGYFSLSGLLEENSTLGNIKYGSSESIRIDGGNTITAIMEGEQMMFFINNNLLASHQADSAIDPVYGIVVWGGPDAKAKNLIDDILVRAK